MGLISECAGVFEFLRDFFDLIPNAIKLLVLGGFGGSVFIAVARFVWR